MTTGAQCSADPQRPPAWVTSRPCGRILNMEAPVHPY